MALNDSGSSSFFEDLVFLFMSPAFFSNTFHLDVCSPVSLSAETSSSIIGTSSSSVSYSVCISGGVSRGPAGAAGVTGAVTTGVAADGCFTAGSAAGVTGGVTTGVAAGRGVSTGCAGGGGAEGGEVITGVAVGDAGGGAAVVVFVGVGGGASAGGGVGTGAGAERVAVVSGFAT